MREVFIIGRRAADYLDRLSDSLTTFRSLLYILVGYVLIAAALSSLGRMPFTAATILVSALLLVVVCKLSNLAFSTIFNVPANHESDILTGLILSLILTPATSAHDYLILVVVAAVAMLSKYVLTINGRHIFNPAALAAFISATVFNEYASWWIGSSYMAIPLIVGGFLIVRKMKRFQMVFLFIGLYLIYRIFIDNQLLGSGGAPSWNTIYLGIVATPLLFFAPIMLTEPLTTPAKRNNIWLYAAFVALFYSVNRFHISPEEALLIGNLFAFIIEPNRSLILEFIKKHQEADSISSYLFRPNQTLRFKPGQYMEWTLPGVGVDMRGNRRYLTIASSPTESNLMFTVKTPDKHSKFKEKLANLKAGERIVSTRLAGEFILPADKTEKLAFIAGGVGITPYRSMVKYLLDRQESRDMTLLYSANYRNEIAYTDLFKSASNVGLKSHFITTKETGSGLHGYIDKTMIKQLIPDYKSTAFYISGPQAFVAAVRLELLDLKVARIITDFFPGYN
jgi:ferredoxin-NADP reductase